MTADPDRLTRSQALVDRFKLTVYLTGWTAVRALPAGMAYRVFRLIADIAWWRRTKSVVRLEQNLRRVVRDADDDALRGLTRAGVRSYFRYWCDAFRIEDWPVDEIVSRTDVVDAHYLRDVVARGDGVIVPLPHIANWDWAGAWACQVVAPVATVAERLRPTALFDRFVAYRESLGMTVLPLTGSPVDPIRALGEHLRGGGLVALPAERDLSRRGVTVSFFGEKTRMPAGPAILHLRTGAPIVPVVMSYGGTEPHHRLRVQFFPPLDTASATATGATTHGAGSGRIQAITQQIAERFEQAITAAPEDWHMMQRLFLADLDPDHPRAREGAS